MLPNARYKKTMHSHDASDPGPRTPDPEPGHEPVLAEELTKLLEPRPGQTVLDCTLGRGGHAGHMIQRIGPGGHLIGLDTDPENAAYARRRIEPIAAAASVRLTVVHCNFAVATNALNKAGISRVDTVIADLGFATSQLNDRTRGFSFAQDGPLDMRLDPTANTPTAADLVNDLPQTELADLLYQLGDERRSRKIAAKIVEYRKRSPIQFTRELADLVRPCYGPRRGRRRIDPATRTFLALRIAVNSELDALEILLSQVPHLLAFNGRVGIISFQSLEDRRVKKSLLQFEQQGMGRRLTKKPVTPEKDELATNPRSRSAKLRGFQRSPA